VATFRQQRQATIWKIKPQTACGKSHRTQRRNNDQADKPQIAGNTQSSLLVEALIANVKAGTRTVHQLKQQLADGLAYIEDQGVHNVQQELLIVINALDIAIQHIELDLTDPGRNKDN
jgi:hypothetical protein